MARDNYGAYEHRGMANVPMEPEFGDADTGNAKRQETLENFRVKRTQPEHMRSSGDATNQATRDIPKGYTQQANQYDPYYQVGGYEAGSLPLVDMDEWKVIQNSVYTVPCVYAEDMQTIDGQGGKERI